MPRVDVKSAMYWPFLQAHHLIPQAGERTTKIVVFTGSSLRLGNDKPFQLQLVLDPITQLFGIRALNLRPGTHTPEGLVV